MKALIAERNDPSKLAELLAVAQRYCDQPDAVVVGGESVAGPFGKAYLAPDTVATNLVGPVGDLFKAGGYGVLILSATDFGAALAGQLAGRLSASCVTGVTGIASDGVLETLIYGGNAVAKFEGDGSPLILTVCRKAFDPAELRGVPEVLKLDVPERARVLSEETFESAGIPLEDASVVVGVGRGVGDQAGFALAQELADALGAAVGASRGAVDDGIAPQTLQVGQTGKIIGPNLYFAIGISGASQHLAGVAKAKCVVAINKDEDANIFRRAQFGLKCDWRKVVPLLLEEYRLGR